MIFILMLLKQFFLKKKSKYFAMKFKVISWNLKFKKPNLNQIRLLSRLDADIFLLQEVHIDFFRELKKTGSFSWAALSLHHRAPEHGEGNKRSLGCAILGKTGKLVESRLLENLVFSERTLIAEVELDSEVFTFCSFHIPPRASWKEIKPETMKKISSWLTGQKNKTIFGIDANTPKLDHPRYRRNKWWWKDEPILMGSQPLHNLKDVYREYLNDNPREYAEIIKKRPEGPLAISYKRGTKAIVPCRYDFIYTTPDLKPSSVEYCYDKAIEAGSDHALVMAELQI